MSSIRENHRSFTYRRPFLTLADLANSLVLLKCHPREPLVLLHWRAFVNQSPTNNYSVSWKNSAIKNEPW